MEVEGDKTEVGHDKEEDNVDSDHNNEEDTEHEEDLDDDDDDNKENAEVEFVVPKIPRSKAEAVIFLMEYHEKYKVVLKGTVLELPMDVNSWNEKYLLR